MRDLPADKAGIAALRHDRRARLVGEFQDRLHLRDRTRPQHQRRVAVIEPALLHEMRLERALIGDGIFVADDAAKRASRSGESGLVSIGAPSAF